MSDEDNQTTESKSSTKSGVDLQDLVKKGVDFVATTAAQAVDAVQEVSDRLTSGSTVRLEQAIGKPAEVSAPIEVGGTGEVIFSLGGSTHNCSARSLDQRRSFKKGSKVTIAAIANQLVYVE